MSRTPTFSVDTYMNRRAALRSKVGSGKILLLGNEEAPKNYVDNAYHFRQDSTFLYYFGIDLPDLCGVIDCDEGIDYLIGDDLTIDHIVWTGPQPSISDLGFGVGVGHTKTFSALPTLLKGKVHYLPPYRGAHNLQLGALLDQHPSSVGEGASLALIKAVIDQRNIKADTEIAEMHKACTISARMHRAVMQATRAGMHEYELVGVASKLLAENNVHFAYPPIMTKNGQTLHIHSHDNQLVDGDIVLFDGGGESLGHYSGDLTRTFPVSGKFSAQQREIYDIVHSMFMTSVENAHAGRSYQSIHKMAATIMVDGLKDLGLMKGDTREAVESGAYAMFFPHGLGHMIGLDVHDMENLGEDLVGYAGEVERSSLFGMRSLRLGRPLKEGNCITIEPGIYFIPELIDLWKSQGLHQDFLNYDKMEAYKSFGGIRLEDDFVITDEGAIVLGESLARSADEIEALMAK